MEGGIIVLGDRHLHIMKKIVWTAFLIGLLALMMAFSMTTKVEYIRAEEVEKIIPEENLTREQRAWLGALEWCESKGKATAVNPKDRDNTPSYGLLQFKPSTFKYYLKRYGIAETKAGYMDPDVQEAIVTQMILRNDVKWSQQFPDCVKKLGKPPVIHSKSVDKN